MSPKLPRFMIECGACFFYTVFSLAAQDSKPPAPARPRPSVDQKRVDQAIRKGIEYLATADSPQHYWSRNSDELILLTLLHGGVGEDEPVFQKYFKKMMGSPLERTYNVALQAMVLEELQRVKYQDRIFQCAQFLVDNQCKNGQWAYGEPTPSVGETPKPVPATKNVATEKSVANPSTGLRQKPEVLRKIPVHKTRDGPTSGDNSNSQYAALGLRACFDAGIILPKETIELASQAWRECQRGGLQKESRRRDSATGDAIPTGDPLGWGYKKRGEEWGSMTAGAVGGLCIYDFMRGKKWKQDEAVARGVAWLGANFSVTENPNHGKWHYYYLYALERVGMLYDAERIGPHFWYPTGAKFLLATQKPDGSWSGSDGKDTWSTCFAILFLKRATRPLEDVSSVDRSLPQK